MPGGLAIRNVYVLTLLGSFLVLLLADREPHARRDLLGAQEILVRGILQVAAMERDQALIAAHVRALIDGHGEMAAAEQFGRRSAPP